MYVCICNGYRDTELRQLAREGFSCPKKAYNALGSGPNCGRCLKFAQEVMDEVHASPAPTQEPVIGPEAAAFGGGD